MCVLFLNRKKLYTLHSADPSMSFKILLIPLLFSLFCIHAFANPAETVVTSDTLDLLTDGPAQEFLFRGNVKVEDTKWTLTCDNLKVESANAKDLKPAGENPKTSVQKITANGNVLIQQQDRQAKAGNAEIYPNEGKIILKDNPSVTHAEGKIEGYQITFYVDNQSDGTPGKIIVEGNPAEPKERPKVTLPALNNHFIEQSSGKATSSSPLISESP